MALSVIREEILHKGYAPFDFNTRKIGKGNLIVAEHGQWAVLNDDELELLEHGVIDEYSLLFKLLEEKGIILTLRNGELIENYYRQRMGFLFHGASLHIIVLTNRCTHKCVYCHASAKGSKCREFDMTRETARKTVDFIFQSPSQTITIEFQGGEPLLNFDVLKFITKYAREKNNEAKKDLRLTVVTNLQLMDNEKLDFLLENNVSICTSLDGPEDIHNSNRIPEDRNFNSYQNVARWAKIIQKRCNDEKKDWTISALVTTTKASLEKPKEIVDEYAKLGFNQICIRHLNWLGFSGENYKKIGYSAKEYIDFWKKCSDYIIELNKKGTLLKERTFLIILSKIFGKTDPGFLDLRSPCGACIGQLAYNYDGKIYSCDEARTLKEDIFMVGDVEQKYSEVLGSNKTCAIVSSSIIDSTPCSECVWKPYCGTCPVSTFSQTNSLIPSTSDDFRCKVHDFQFEYVFEKIMDKDFQEKIVKKWF